MSFKKRTEVRSYSSPAEKQETSASYSPICSNIKVVCRIRPFLEFELDFHSKEKTYSVNSGNSVSFSPAKNSQSFVFDKAFDTDATQEEIYQFVGKSTIQDVIYGFNGTIIAYGQTGSGKTFTMMGESLYDTNSSGVIPRAAFQIFASLNNPEVEYTLKCSMIEIYKERLRDLLETEGNNLRIKECPKRGVHVEGLSEVCLTSEEEMLELLSIGEQMRTVAATKLNKTSSRSHLLFVLQVIQKFPSGSEKRGKLNLVDLAGSEKVNHSGVTGNKLEEAKKINLSLSALGNVIHALTSNSEHVPYRNSKLTRLLQESLGGNYKTTLIVTCSPSSRNIEETIRTMKFAARAKAIQNKVRVNVSASPQNYIQVIQQLKTELKLARNELLMLKGDKESTYCTDTRSNVSSSRHSPKPLRGKSGYTNRSSRFPSGEIKDIASLEDFKLPEENSPKEKKLHSLFESESLSCSFQLLPQAFDYFSDSKITEQLKVIQETYQQKVEKYKTKANLLKSENQSLKEQVFELQSRLKISKNKQLQLELKAHEYYQSYNKTLHLINKDASENAKLKYQTKSLHRQVQTLTQNLENLDLKFKKFIENYKSMGGSTYIEFEDTETHFSIDSVDLSDDSESESQDASELRISTKRLSFDRVNLPMSNYSEELQKALMENTSLNKDVLIFQLKNQLTQAGIINENLGRSLNNAVWKIGVVKDKYKMKQFLCRQQNDQIKALEEMVDYLHDSYNHIVKLYEQTESGNSTVLKESVRKNSHLVRSFHKKGSESVSHIRSRHGSICSIKSESTEGFHSKFKSLETSLHLQQLYNFQLKQACEEYKYQSEHLKKVLQDQESEVFKAHKAERGRWCCFFEELKKNCEAELLRKQQECLKLQEALGDWIQNYMQLQEQVGSPDPGCFQELKFLISLTKQACQNRDSMSEIKNYFSKSPFSASPPNPSGVSVKKELSTGDKTPI